MKFCSHCGKEIVEEAVICPGCGCPVESKKTKVLGDKCSIGWGVLGFFIPIVGLILYLVNRTKNPAMAKTAGIGALIGFNFWAMFLIIGQLSSVLDRLHSIYFEVRYPSISRSYY